MAPVTRPADAGDALVLIDATSGAGGLPLDASQTDVYYFAPQKCLASDGGLWLALCSPAAIARIEEVASRRPALDPRVAVAGHRAGQLAQGPDLQHAGAGDADPARRPAALDAGQRRSSVVRITGDRVLGPPLRLGLRPRLCHAVRRRRRPRSLVVGTIDFDDEVDAAQVAATLRANGIVDTEPYRKLGRNQLRIAMFPAIEPDDIRALTACIDWVVERIA